MYLKSFTREIDCVSFEKALEISYKAKKCELVNGIFYNPVYKVVFNIKQPKS